MEGAFGRHVLKSFIVVLRVRPLPKKGTRNAVNLQHLTPNVFNNRRQPAASNALFFSTPGAPVHHASLHPIRVGVRVGTKH